MGQSCWKVSPWWLRSIQGLYIWDNLLLWVSFIWLLIAGAGAGCLAQERLQIVVVMNGINIKTQQREKSWILLRLKINQRAMKMTKILFHVFKRGKIIQMNRNKKGNFVQNKESTLYSNNRDQIWDYRLTLSLFHARDQ